MERTMGKFWVIVQNQEMRKALKRYVRYIFNDEDIDNRSKSLEDFIEQDLKDPETLKNNKQVFLIDFSLFNRKKQELINYENGIVQMDDPFKYPICDLIATLLFDKESFYDGNKNWFLSRTIFLSYLDGIKINDSSIELNYLSICELQKLTKLERKEIEINDEQLEELTNAMQKALKDAFEPHGRLIE